ncbi:MAG: CPP1-like family protein [Cyanobacteria bacterium P01_E01_bin.34]
MNSNSQVSGGMGDRGPYQVLGVAEDASFEEIQTARDRQLAVLDREAEQQEVEQAYDAILMQRLRLRKEGKIPVPDRIRYPDRERVTSAPKKKAPRSRESTKESWLSGWVDTPSPQDIWLPLAVMAVPAVLTIFYQGEQFPSWALAFALLASLYFLFSKEKRFWRSLLIAVSGLALGLFFAFAVVSGFTLASPSIPLTVVLSLLVMWLFTAFLR